MGIGLPGSVPRVDQAPCHPEVNQENQTALEPNNQILATARNSGHALPLELGSHLCGLERSRQAGIGDLDRVESAADKLRFERRPDGLDLGQLGHRSSLATGLAHAIITPRMTLRGFGASAPSSYAARTSSAAAAALSSSRAWISARPPPSETSSRRFFRHRTPTEYSIGSSFSPLPALSRRAAF